MNSPDTSFSILQPKDRDSSPQVQIVHEYLLAHIASRFIAAVATRIPIRNVCRHIDSLRKQESIAVARVDRYHITGEEVEFFTTDTSNFPVELQQNHLILFNHELGRVSPHSKEKCLIYSHLQGSFS